MNKTDIEWCDYTWNPVTGCLHACRNVYCYNTMKSNSFLNRFGAQYRVNENIIREKNWRTRESNENHIATPGEKYPYGYDPTLYPHRLSEPKSLKKPAKIFVVDAGDLFGAWVPDTWIVDVLNVIRECPQHTFQLLTKNPQRLLSFEFPQNAWVGTSINSDKDANRAEIVKRAHASVRYLSIEPLLGEVAFDFTGIDWIIVGAMTGKNSVIPEKEWIDGILTATRENNIPVFMKKNMERYYPEGKSLKEFP